MVGSVDRDHLEDLIIGIPGKGWIVAVPYQSDRNIPDGFYQSLQDLVTSRNEGNLPVVMAAHLTVKGSDYTGHEDVRDVSVGGIDGVDLAVLGTDYDYAALGHIHRPQTIPGSNRRARYSGTPVAVSFDEAYAHSVSLVSIAVHGDPPEIDTIEIRNPRPLVTLPTKGFGKWEDVKALLEGFPKDKPAYLRLNVEVDDYLPKSAQEEAKAILKDTPVKFTYINSRRKQVADGKQKSVTVAEFQAMAPLSVAEMYARDKGIEFTDALKQLFRDAESQVKSEESK
jgi:exonuclease SbcD